MLLTHLHAPWARPRRLEFVEPELDDSEWERESVGPVHARPLLWTSAPPATPGWYYVRRPGQVAYEPIEVLSGFEYPSGFEYAGPLPRPYEVKTVRRR